LTEAPFGDGVLRLALGPSIRPDALVIDDADAMVVEDDYKHGFHAFAAKGKEIAIFAPPSSRNAAAALYTVAGELARGGKVNEAVFILPDKAAFAAYEKALAELCRKK
jgi:hypothetical protein